MMVGYVDQLKELDFDMGRGMLVDLILSSLPDSYDRFIKNYLLSDMECSLTELHTILKGVEMTIPNPNQITMLMMERKKNEFSAFGNGKGKARVKGKAIVGGPFADDSQNNVKCFRCGEFGHWMRNYPVHLLELEEYTAIVA
ncbi:hypothetical protein L1987_09021 [Smallanthus sonchifolius]|uniref:Uncharacterized protein n=1 Tax=Smallanthus sonchifolius TaxID=185202 RepID=A0ACB9JLT1_9ASTR|nr:hypothetical protein L1987_09021 [Smallanthus sonchifolius]